MPSFLFIISFLLHLVLLMVVYYLFQQVQLLKRNNMDEVIDLFETYLQEIKAENKRLEEITSHPYQAEQKEVAKQTITDDINSEVKENITEKNMPELPENTIDDVFEASLEARILQLYHQGLEVDKIAQKLNCGKTEAALIIDLSEKRKQQI